MQIQNGYLLGLDVGSTNIKCAAITPEGKILSILRESCAAVQPEGRIDWDMEQLLELVLKLLAKTVRKLAGSAEPLGIAVSGIGCKAILLDRNGAQIPLPETQFGFKIPEYASQVTGYPWDYPNGGLFLAAMAKETPGLVERVEAVLSVSDYLSFRLCGAAVSNYSCAGSMSLMDKQKKEWWIPFAKSIGLKESALPPLTESGRKIGGLLLAIAEETGLPAGLPVSSGGHDYLCAALAVGCLDSTRILNVLGSYEMIASFGTGPVSSLSGNEIYTFCDNHVCPGVYAYTEELISALQVEWVHSHLLSTYSDFEWSALFSQIDRERHRDGPRNRMLFIPRVLGDSLFRLAFPVTGGFIGMDGNTCPADLLRCSIEGINMASKHAFSRCVLKNKQIIVLGGGTRSSYWISNKADILGRTLYLPDVPEASAAGAALLAGVGSGIYSDCTEASQVFARVPVRIVEPHPGSAEKWEEFYHQRFLPALNFMCKIDGKGKERKGIIYE